MMVLEVDQLRKRYGVQEILDIDSWQIPSGIYWIQGENGAGKSTLFWTLAGMLPFDGQVLLNGDINLKTKPVDYLLKLNLGEAEPLYPSFLTPKDLMAFVAECKCSPTSQSAMLIDALGINYMDSPFGTCSSGMVKKVSLAVAFLGNPSVIILDEPLITIDQDARTALFALIQEYHTNGVTFLLSSHQRFTEGNLPLSAIYELKNKKLIQLTNV
jgi:ABC-2 type transport system ATP-binding protein